MVDSTNGDKTNATVQTLRKFRSNPLALWRGYTALAGRNLPFTALQFPIFERLKESIKRHRDDKGIRTNTLLESGLITAASAGTAGSFAAVVTTPVDVVKTRIMLGAGDGPANEPKPSSEPKKAADGIVDAMGKSAQAGKEGLKNAAQSVTKPAPRKGSIAIAKEIIREQGVKGLFRGGALRAVWTMIGSGLYLGVYEAGRIQLAKRHGQKLEEKDIL